MRVIITHTDLDGVASAALICREINEPESIYFTQPHQLGAVLSKIPDGAYVYVTDLGINENTYSRILMNVKRIINSGGAVRWFDHHIWDKEWIDELSNLGAEVYVDTSTCAAGVVMRHFPVSGEGVNELVSATCSIDLWLFNDWRGNFLARYVGYKGGREWRVRAMRLLKEFRGELTPDIIGKVSEVFDDELRIYSDVVSKAGTKLIDGIRLAYYFKNNNEHVTSFIGNLMLSRFTADVALICKYKSISLRSRGFNVREVAKILGGGGHPQASGAKIKPPFWRLITALLGYKKPLLNWCVSKVSEAISAILES